MFAQELSPPSLLQTFGRRALEWTRRAVELGPRSTGSIAHQELQSIIRTTLKPLTRAAGGSLHLLNFTAQTPIGPVPMTNIIAKFPGVSDRTVIVSGHYDTYKRDGLEFVGANDGGSSTGFLLALAELLAANQSPKPTSHAGSSLKKPPIAPTKSRKNSIWLVFFDGEESFVRWSTIDSTYGSRQLAATWAKDGTASRLQALINIDMIGDRNLQVFPEGQSTPWLRQLVVTTAERLGYGTTFLPAPVRYIADDHIPFIKAGVPAVNLIDFQFGPDNRYWHTKEDTLDKLSARSFSIVLHVVLETLSELDKTH